jgi:hypothetical protein
MSELPGNTQQLLGQLIAQMESLEKRMDRSDAFDRERDKTRDAQICAILRDVEELKRYMIENRGGKRLLILLLTAAGTAGATLTEIVQRIIHFR